MKKLIIIRHSKSDWNHNTSDLLRPISDRGIKDAKIMSNVLNKLKLQVDHIFISTAKRTIETANIFLIFQIPKFPTLMRKKFMILVVTMS